MRLSRISVLAWTCSFLTLGIGQAHAQRVPAGTTNTQEQSQMDPLLKPAARRIASPETFVLELKGGPDPVFADTKYDTFANDSGPLFAAQLDGIMMRLPDLLYVTLGGRIGYAAYAAPATSKATGEAVSEETTLSLVPLAAMAGVRLDVLPRKLSIPLIFAARVGWQWTHWDTNTGKVDDAAGWSLGPIFSAQVALDLDTFEPGGARALDEEWGINHTYILGEITHFAATGKSLPVGGTRWSIGLGLTF